MNVFADLGAEKSVIGSILQDETCLRLLDELRPEDFSCPEFAEIFRAAARLRAKHQAVDMQTIHAELGSMADLISVSFLIDAVRYTPSTANADSYAAIVRERSRRRQVKAKLEGAIQSIGDQDADTVIDVAMDDLRGMMNGSGNTLTSAQIAQKTFEMLDGISRGEIRSIPTPLVDLNWQISGGLRKGEVTVLAAYTGQGKSALAQTIGRYAARRGFRTLLVSREMGPEQYGIRALSSITGMDSSKLLQAKKLDSGQWTALADACNEMSSLPLDFTFRAATVEDVRQEVRRMKNVDLLIVDYLQILQTRDKYQSDNSRVSHISRTIKEIALDMQIPVLALSQFSRPPKGTNQRPKVSDLRDSGSIEQDADNIWLMWQPTDGDDTDIPVGYGGWFEAAKDIGDRFLLLDVAKQRMGRTGVIGICFNPQKMEFYTPIAEE